MANTDNHKLALSYCAERAKTATGDQLAAWVDRLHVAVLRNMADQDTDLEPSCYGCAHCGLLYGH